MPSTAWEAAEGVLREPAVGAVLAAIAPPLLTVGTDENVT
jgi:hypothetical protein